MGLADRAVLHGGRTLKNRGCHICGLPDGEHEEDLHEAIQRIRKWFLGRLLLGMAPVDMSSKAKTFKKRDAEYPKIATRTAPTKPSW